MKEILSLFTFGIGIGALCFVMFVTISSRMPSVRSPGRAARVFQKRSFLRRGRPRY